ncbi:MAG: hypothetical protein KAI94_02835 [Anaerolineales bacterium]|nr:hypothetical protein [Anaerolineales bacterium]
MKNKKRRLFLAVSAVIVSAIACNMPPITRSTPSVYPTADLTRTALYESVSATASQTAIAPTATLTIVPTTTATITPSITVPPPTHTSTPVPYTSTFTPIPYTATPTATNTPVSYVGPSIRPGTSIKAYYLRREPTIDGVFDEWELDRYPVDNLVYGVDRWSGRDDLFANVMVGWDDNNLYIAVRVIDDKYVQNAAGEGLFKGDSLEVLMDTKVSNDFYLETLSLDDYQLGVSPGSPQPGTNPEAYLWYPRSEEGGRGKVKIGAMLTDNGHRVEVKIPWDTFDIIPAKGVHYGFAFSVSDNDHSDENVQQSMVSTSPKRNLTNPMTWGDLILLGQYSP